MDRFQLYSQLKSNFQKFDDPDIKERLDIMISPLYLFALKCNEGGLEKRFAELSILEKLKILPEKISERLRTNKKNSEITKAQRVNAQLPKNKVIFYPVEPTHLNQMIPVSNTMPEGSFFYITDRFHIYTEFKNKGIACYLLDIPAIQKTYDYDFSSLGEGFIHQTYAAQWNQQCRLYLESRFDALKAAIDNALNLLQPHKLVIGYDITPEGRMAVYLCKEKKIPSVCIQHGSIAGEPMDGEHIVENYILYGSKAKDYLVEIGNMPESLKVFGAPYLDAKLGNRSNGSQVYQALGIPKENKFILVALSGPGHCTTLLHFNRIVSSLVRFAKENRTYSVVFKLHRKDSASNYTGIFKDQGFECSLVESGDTRFPNDIFYWLDAADLLVTGSSTVALEAMLVKIPVMTIDYNQEYKDIDFIDENCTFHVSSEKNLGKMFSQIAELGPAINQNSIMVNSRNYIDQYFKLDDIPASVKIAGWLKA